MVALTQTMLQLWHSLVAITWLFPGCVLTYSTSHCSQSDINGLRTWGPNCQLLCHCNNEATCDSSGYCANGCSHGWARLTSNGSCSVEISNNSTPNSRLLSGSHYTNSTTIRDERSIPFEKDTPLYRFQQDDTCTTDRTGAITKFASILANPPVMIRELTVIFKVKPLIHDITKATFNVRNFENDSVTHVLKYNPPDKPNMLSVRELRGVLADSITVAVTSMPVAADCSPAIIEGYIISGKPICPYGKWGVKCERTCVCPCKFRECHPTSGRCLQTGIICPAMTFGQSCSTACSSGCFGYPLECHALTGECKACALWNMSGVSCTLALTLEQVILRDGGCKSVTDHSDKPASLYNDSTVFGEFQVSQLQQNKYRVAIIITVFLIFFFFACCCYVQIVQHCAKRRMKERLLTLDEMRRKRSSLATYTEFNKEFMEMQEDGSMSFLRRSHKPTTGQQSIDLDTT